MERTKVRKKVKRKTSSEVDKVVAGLEEAFGDEGLVVPSSAASRKRLYSAVACWLDIEMGKTANAVLGKAGKGLPMGRVYEIFGPESHGKTTLGLYILGETQKAGGIAILVDVEDTYDPEWGEKLGIDNSSLVIIQLGMRKRKAKEKAKGGGEYGCEGMEDVFMKIEKVVTKIREDLGREIPITIVWDSVAMTKTRRELDKGYEDEKPAQQAACMAKRFPTLVRFVSRESVLLICINQIREKVGVLFGPTKTTPAGKTLKFTATIRAEVVKIKSEKKKKKVGIKCKIVNCKNKIAPPFKECTFEINEDGIEID